MIKIDTPNTLVGLEQVNSYLHQLAEKINLNFANTTAEVIWADTAKALSVLGDKEASAKEKADILTSYSAMRSLIIKTADYAIENSEKIKLSMSGEYVAISDFGKYFENATVDIEGTPVGITQLYGYTSGITGEFGDITVDSHNFIKTGLLYYDNNSIPIYGVGVGELATKVDANGHTVLDRSNLLATYTADEIAFWQNSEKVAYINNGELYMPAAKITGGTLNINNRFTVDLLGNMKADNAEITGKVKCTELDCTNATVKGLVVGENVTMGANAVISWDKVSGAPGIPARTSDLFNDSGYVDGSAVTVITQSAIQTGDLHLGGSVYHMTGQYWWNSEEHLLLGINSYGNLQIGSPSIEADYENANIYAQGNIYLLPGGGILGGTSESGNDWTMVIRGVASTTGQGVSIHGKLSTTEDISVGGSYVVTNSDLNARDFATKSYVTGRGYYSSGDNIYANKLYVANAGTISGDPNARLATSSPNQLGYSSGSSMWFKHDIKPVENEELNPHHLYDIKVYQFKYNDDYLNENDQRYGVDCIGFIAEQVNRVYPIAADCETGKPRNWEMRYIIPPMLALVQEHKKEIDALKQRIIVLENGGERSGYEN